MRAFLARRLLHAVAIVLAAATISFALIRLAPGDPFIIMGGDRSLPAEVIAGLREQWGFDRPLHEQYLSYLEGMARGDLGYSFSQKRPVADAMAEALPRTLLVMGLALTLSFALGIAVGIAQARRRGRLLDRMLSGISLFFYSMPDFWLAVMAMLVFASWLRLLPTSGLHDPTMYSLMSGPERLLDLLRHLVLPVGTLTLLTAALIARYQRSAMLEAGSQDYVRTARAKGVPERLVVLRHTLRNALLPVITLLGLALPALLAGAVFIEWVFAIPGMGWLSVNAIATRDYPTVTASVVIGSALVAVGSLLADLLYAVADPRLREH